MMISPILSCGRHQTSHSEFETASFSQINALKMNHVKRKAMALFVQNDLSVGWVSSTVFEYKT